MVSLGPGSTGLRNISCSLCTLLCPQQGLSPTHCVGTIPLTQHCHPKRRVAKDPVTCLVLKGKRFPLLSATVLLVQCEQPVPKEGAEVGRGLPLTALKPADL